MPLLRRACIAFSAVLGASLLVGCAVYKPARVLTPEAFGMTCVSDTMCLEDVSRQTEAQALYDEAAVFVQSRLAPFKTPPRALFCSTDACASRFGTPEVAALNVSTFGMVINPVGWSPHILRHEMIHHLQNETFGRVAASVTLPRWFIEGAAYTLSEDPRQPLPRADIEGWRSQFLAWTAQGNSWRDRPNR